MDELNEQPQKCSACGYERPHEDFVGTNGQQRLTCARCRAKTRRAHGKIKKEREGVAKLEGQNRGWRLSRFGITAEQYDVLLAHQGGTCAICHGACSSGRQLAIDHDHATGRIRGLLCTSCNIQLGVFESFGDRAAAYLKENGAGSPLLNGEGTHAPLGKGRWGAGNGMSKLTVEVAAEIRRRYAGERITQRALAAEFGISQNAVSCVVRGTRWASKDEMRVERTREFVAAVRKLSDADVEEIRARRASGESRNSIARNLGVARSTIYYWLQQAPATGDTPGVSSPLFG